MSTFIGLPELYRSGFTLWAFLVCCTGIAGIIFSFAVHQTRCGVLSLVTFAAAFFLWQVTIELNPFVFAGRPTGISARMGRIPLLFWLLILFLLTAAAILSLVFASRYAGTNINPLTIKHCADRINCGICYWRDNGRVIFSNECMNRLCTSMTGHSLTNGNTFLKGISADVIPVGDRVWRFAFRDLEFDKGTLHEMIASDVTEIHTKAEALRKENEELSRLKEELKIYGLQIDETVRAQEILQAKVKIHDEMNRLMLSTVAVDLENQAESDRIFTQWQENALLLCLQVEERKDSSEIEQLKGFARALDICPVWENELPCSLTPPQKELFFITAHEAVTNAVKHAGAKTIRISFQETGSSVCCFFENGGIFPTGKVIFTGGLANLAHLADKQNAELTAKAGQTFTLCLTLKKMEAVCRLADAESAANV